MTIADIIGWLFMEAGAITIALAIALTVHDRKVIVTE